MMEPVAGKVVLVTGAAKRMGRAIALRLHAEGARVAIHYGGSESEAREVSELCGGAPIFQADLESVAAIRDMVARVDAHFGRLDGLVNNAARFTGFDVMDIEERDWDFVHSVNLKSVFFCCQAAVGVMRRNGYGRIVNISSLGGLQHWPEHIHYCASKAGVISLTKSLAKAVAPVITVNSVAPGVFPFGKSDERIRRLIAKTPAGRAGDGDEVADAVIYFLTATNFVTGQVVAVDGGLAT